MTRRRAGQATLSLELSETGRHWGSLALPWSRDDSAYGQLVNPVAVVNGPRPGPTALLTAGIHGDEYEGQITLLDLARTLAPERVSGRVIIVPAANLPAVRAGRRTSPVDGGNLARVFPGDPEGSLTDQIADAITRLLLPHADLVIDLHGGGQSLDYLPCAWGRLPPDRVLAEKVIDALVSFGAPRTAVVMPAENRGTLVATALEGGKVAIATEIGGGGTVFPRTLAVMRSGVERVLTRAGILHLRDPDELPPTRLLVVRPEHFLRSPDRGLFEPRARAGEEVQENQIAGLLHDLDRPEADPRPVVWGASGVLLCRRVSPRVESGDVLGHLASDTDRRSLLEELPP